MRFLFSLLVLVLAGVQNQALAQKGGSKNSSGGKSVYVSGYRKKDGTYVRPHFRSAPGTGIGPGTYYGPNRGTFLDPREIPSGSEPEKEGPSVSYGDITIRIPEVSLQVAGFEGPKDYKFTNEPVLVISLSLGTSGKPITVSTFANQRTKLTDARGREIKPIFRLEKDLIPTGQLVGEQKVGFGQSPDLLVFERPAEDAGDLKLQLGQAGDKDKQADVLIPHEAIREERVRK